MSARPIELPTDHEWLPQHCPAWCLGDHAETLAELGHGRQDWVDAQEHRGPQFEEVLWELRNPGGDYVLRPGVARYSLECVQRPRHPNGARPDAEAIRMVAEEINGSTRATINLLPSEARTLAVRLLRLADVMELGS